MSVHDELVLAAMLRPALVVATVAVVSAVVVASVATVVALRTVIGMLVDIAGAVVGVVVGLPIVFRGRIVGVIGLVRVAFVEAGVDRLRRGLIDDAGNGQAGGILESPDRPQRVLAEHAFLGLGIRDFEPDPGQLPVEQADVVAAVP